MTGSIRRDYGHSTVAYFSLRFDAYSKDRKLWKERQEFVKLLLKNDFDVELYINPYRIQAVKDDEIFSIDIFEDTGASILPIKWVTDPQGEPVYLWDIPAQGQTLDPKAMVGILNRRPQYLRLVRRIADQTIFPAKQIKHCLEEDILNPKPLLVKYKIGCHAIDCLVLGEHYPRKDRKNIDPVTAYQQSISPGWSFQWKDLQGHRVDPADKKIMTAHFFCSQTCHDKGCENLNQCATKYQEVWEQPDEAIV